jgi:outer membrane lipoprotein-sorting protein
MRPFAVAFFLAAVALAEEPAPPKPDSAAEELLKKIEAKIQGAKTVRVRASLAVRLGRYPVNREIEIDFKEGNRARLLLTGGAAPEGVACNGKESRVQVGPGVTTAAAAADFAAKAREILLRVPMDELRGYFLGSPRPAPAYTEFAFLPDEKIGERAVRVVTFVATRDGNRQVFRTWIDEKSLELVKREYVEKFGETETRETLTIASTSFDADIPDAAFDSVEGKTAEDPVPAKADPAAEELVKKLEAKVAAAKSVSMAFAMEVAADDEKQVFKVALDLKEGNRVRLAVDGLDSDGKVTFSLRATCDGKTVRRTDPDGWEDDDADAGLAARMRDMAVRSPVKEISKVMGGNASKTPLAYSGFAFAPDEKIGERTARVVTFAATRGSVRLEMKLWFDAEKMELLKRETLEKRKGVETRVTDTFTTMTCDAELADDVFGLPDVKGLEKKEEK